MSFDVLNSTLKDLERYRDENQVHAEELKQRQLREELKELFKPVPPFSPEEMTEEAKAKRIRLSKADFWQFDRIYFPPEMYRDYSAPGKFHRYLVSLADKRDKKGHVIHGPRGAAKTVTYKKKFVHAMIFGTRRVMGIGSEIMLTSNQWLLDLITLIKTNDRLQYDYKIDWLEQSSESIFMRTDQNPKGTFVKPYSQDRSTRAAQRMFDRLDFMYVTDLENITSSLTKDAVGKRAAILNEMRTSLTDDGTLIWEGNNFDPDCLMNRLFQEEEKGILSEEFVLHRVPAWADKDNPSSLNIRGSIWPEKWPAKSEEQMKKLCKPADKYDWKGNFQGKPEVKSGEIFPEAHYQEWRELPRDLRAVIWTDPNLSKKGMGDTTAMPCFGFSPSTQNYYFTAARCRSYSNSDQLLSDLLVMRREQMARGVRLLPLHFDGNVSQESTWTNNVVNYSMIHGFPYPVIEYKHYRVDDLVKSAELIWKAGRVFFPPEFRKTTEGKEFTDQLFSFEGKKANKRDDAPDSFISAMEALTEGGIVSRPSDGTKPIRSFSTRKITERL